MFENHSRKLSPIWQNTGQMALICKATFETIIMGTWVGQVIKCAEEKFYAYK